MKRIKSIVYLFVVVLAFSACEKESEANTANEVVQEENPNAVFFAEDGTQYGSESQKKSFFREVIEFEADSLYPEGVEFDFRRNRFLVSSLGQGTIGTVSRSGVYTPFIEDEILKTTVGLHIDNITDRIYVAINDRAAGTSAVAGYSLKTKKRVLYVNLSNLLSSPGSFVNDLITDYKGNVYATDSAAAVVYKISKTGEASILLDDPALVTSQGFGLNGITYHPFGFLLVATGDDVFFKIPVDNPQDFSVIDLGIGGFVDGIQITSLSTIYAVAGSPRTVFELKSDDNWETVEVKRSYEPTAGLNPTTLTNSYFSLYVVNAYLSELGSTPPVSRFSIEKVQF